MSRPYITLKIINKNKKVTKTIGTRKTRRVFDFIQADEGKDCLFKLKVNYGGGFTNEGEYSSKQEVRQALRAFLEKG